MTINLEVLWIIVGMAVVTYLTRWLGPFLMSRVTLSKRIETWLSYLPGTILVSLEINDEQWMELCIRDDGKGLPSGFDITQHAFFGWQLISTLAQQLEGLLTVTGKAGVWVRLVFPPHIL